MAFSFSPGSAQPHLTPDSGRPERVLSPSGAPVGMKPCFVRNLDGPVHFYDYRIDRLIVTMILEVLFFIISIIIQKTIDTAGFVPFIDDRGAVRGLLKDHRRGHTLSRIPNLVSALKMLKNTAFGPRKLGQCIGKGQNSLPMGVCVQHVRILRESRAPAGIQHAP